MTSHSVWPKLRRTPRGKSGNSCAGFIFFAEHLEALVCNMLSTEEASLQTRSLEVLLRDQDQRPQQVPVLC